MARMTKETAVSQCTKRSKALKRMMVRPVRPSSMRMVPCHEEYAVSIASMPKMTMPPIHFSVTV